MDFNSISVLKKILFVTLILLIYDSNNNIDVSEYEVKSYKISKDFKGFKILQLSDLHNKKFGKDNIKLIENINKIKPDIIVITGDMLVYKSSNYKTFFKLAVKLSRDYKIYYIMGNHEQRICLKDKKIYKLLNMIEKLGTTILDNKMIKLVKGNSYINLYGVDIDLKYYKYTGFNKKIYLEEEEMKASIGESNIEVFNILLAHNPLYFKTYASWGADITLSGHIHGGMIRLPFVGALLSPERKFFPKYAQGKYVINDKTLIVNRGLGSGKIFFFRLFNRPELSVITLQNRD